MLNHVCYILGYSFCNDVILAKWPQKAQWPLKAYYIQACEKFLQNNLGRNITQFQLSKLIRGIFACCQEEKEDGEKKSPL